MLGYKNRIQLIFDIIFHPHKVKDSIRQGINDERKRLEKIFEDKMLLLAMEEYKKNGIANLNGKTMDVLRVPYIGAEKGRYIDEKKYKISNIRLSFTSDYITASEIKTRAAQELAVKLLGSGYLKSKVDYMGASSNIVFYVNTFNL
jgi:hypothetical protein